MLYGFTFLLADRSKEKIKSLMHPTTCTGNLNDGSARRITSLRGRSLFPRFRTDGVKILFTSSGRGYRHVYHMNTDGSDLECLTEGGSLCQDPVYSQDGAYIAYIVSPPKDEDLHDIYLMHSDGTGKRALTTTGRESFPSFSPDGQHIAFISGRGGRAEIYRMHLDGTGQQCLTVGESQKTLPPGTITSNLSPIYTRDGGEIVFVSTNFLPSASGKSGSYARQPSQLYRMSADGQKKRCLLSLEEDCLEPQFSPKGDLLAFRNRVSSNAPVDLCLMHWNTSTFTRLPGSDGAWVSFHPQANRILFASRQNYLSPSVQRIWKIYEINLDDGALRCLTDHAVNHTCPSISPDGKQIVFCSDRDGFTEIYTMPYSAG